MRTAPCTTQLTNLPSQGPPTMGDKITSGYITPTFSGAQNWAEWLHNPYLFGGPQTWGQNEKWLHDPCLLGVPMVGKDGYGCITPCRIGVPIVGKDQHGYITPAVLGLPKAGTAQRTYTANSTLGMGHKGTICGGERPKKVKKVTTIGGDAGIGVCII